MFFLFLAISWFSISVTPSLHSKAPLPLCSIDLFGKNLSPLVKKINLPNTINAYLFEDEEGESFALIEIRESEYGKGEPHLTYTNLELIYEGYIPFRSMNNDLLNGLAILLGVYVPLLD